MITPEFIAAVPFLLFAASLVMIELGYRYRMSRLLIEAGSNPGISLISGTVLSLMGLVLAFSFSSASARLEASRKSILDEANAIETTWLRIDLAEDHARHRLRGLFRNYVDARIRAYEALPELGEYHRQADIAADLLGQAWPIAMEGTSLSVNRTLLLTSLNAVSDAAAVRKLSLRTHLPTGVTLFLFGIVLTGSLLVGTMLGDARSRQWFHRVVIAAVLTSIVFVIMDLEFPRMGMFDLLEGADGMFVDLRRLMQ